MARFNKKRPTSKTTNLAGGRAYKQSDKASFVSMLLTSFVSNQFYRSAKKTIEFTSDLMKGIDPKFCAKASIYARKTFGMRSITHVVSAELAHSVKGQEWTKKFYKNVINRPDDVLEILSYYLNKFSWPLPNSLKKGLGMALSEFDEYQLGKYKGGNKDISLVDAVNLCHPKATEALSSLMKGTLKTPETWETGLTQAGQKAESEEELTGLKAEVWKKLIYENKLGYFALLRNLRNIFEQAPSCMDEALKQLIDPVRIKNSLVMPFRFVTAKDQFMTIRGTSKIIGALSKAVGISCSNVPRFEGRTVVVLDVSGSMSGFPSKIGSLFTAILAKANNADVMLFDGSAWFVNFNPEDSVLTICDTFEFDGGSTNFNAIMPKINFKCDRIIVLSDMQGWVPGRGFDSSYESYCTRYNCRPFVYSFDLQGYGTLQMPQDKVFCLAGFSDKVFDIMKLLEQDKNAMVNEIEKIDF